MSETKVKTSEGETHYRTIWFDDGKKTLYYINQNLLPFRFETAESRSYEKTVSAIKDMTIRGAGAIGAAAGFAVAQGFLEGEPEQARKTIEATRPTAVDLFKAAARVYERGVREGADAAVFESKKIADENAAAGEKIGENGSSLIKNGARVLTHCNAGWLAFVDWGTALAPVYYAKREAKSVFVYVDETRPRGQGAKLTAWELENEGVPHAVIADNAAAFFMSRHEIDFVIVGADRIAANGDVANKIGTLEKAVCAARFGIPFYVAAPLSTIDSGTANGSAIPIEERSGEEVLYQKGFCAEDKEIKKILVANPDSKAKNPAFDVTPAEFVTAIITEKGIIEKPDKQKIEAAIR